MFEFKIMNLFSTHKICEIKFLVKLNPYLATSYVSLEEDR